MKSCYLLLLSLMLPLFATAEVATNPTADAIPTSVFRSQAVMTQMDLPVTFEATDVDYGLDDFGQTMSMLVADPTDATNTVAQFVKPAGAETWAGTSLSSTSGGPKGFATAIPFSPTANTISVRVWSPTAGTPVLLKAEDATDPTISVETLVNTTVAGGWETLVFDFSSQAPGTAAINYSNTYDLLSIFFNFNTSPTANETYYFDDVYFGGTGGGGGGTEVGPMTAAPAPIHDTADVIAIFSDAYPNVPVDTFITDWSVGTLTDTTIEGNATLLYRNLAYAGIETLGDNAIDLIAAGMTHLHLDFWSPNSTTFRTKLVDFGGDGYTEGDGNDTEFEIARDLARGQWVSVDYPLTSFVGMNQDDISQLVISSEPAGSSTVYLDNIYFYKGEPLGSQMDLPVTFEDPTVDYGVVDFGGAASVIVADPTDSTNTVVKTTKTGGAETWGGTTLTSSQGGPLGFASRIPITAEASTMTVRVWSPAAGVPVLLKIEDKTDPTISVETLTNTTVAGAWDTLTFDFKNQAPGTAAVNYSSTYNMLSIFFNFGTSPAADQTYYWDDVALGGTSGGGGGGAAEPMTAAPTPTRAAENVISLFSDAYTDVTVDTWRTEWSAATLEDIMIEGNPTKKYTSLDFVGIETIGANAINLTDAGMTHLHVDYWTPNMDTLRIKLVDFGMNGFDPDGPVNDTEAEPVFMTTQGEWVSMDIPLTTFAGMNQTDINQMILSGLPVGAGTLYIDNVYYYKEVTDGVNTPQVGLLEAYPNPIADVVKISAPEKMQTLLLFSTSGQLVGQWTPKSEQFNVEMGHLAPGNYVALARTSQGLMTIKLLKQ